MAGRILQLPCRTHFVEAIYKDLRHWHYRCFQKGVHATFFQKVLICAFAGFLAASLVEWARVFVEGADDALNKGYKHRAVLDPIK